MVHLHQQFTTEHPGGVQLLLQMNHLMKCLLQMLNLSEILPSSGTNPQYLEIKVMLLSL